MINETKEWIKKKLNERKCTKGEEAEGNANVYSIKKETGRRRGKKLQHEAVKKVLTKRSR